MGALRFGPLGPTPSRDSRYTLSALMRANPAIIALTPIAVHAENLKHGRKAIANDPAMHLLASLQFFFSLVFRPIVIDVVKA
jgi:hypothetical protein